MASIEDVRRIVAMDSGLASLSTTRANGLVQSVVVNAGVIDHPLTKEPAAAFVARPGTAKLTHMRRTQRATLLWRSGWAWVAAEGTVELAGPDDPLAGLDGTALPALLREIHAATGAGADHDWLEFDRTVAAERRVAVLLTPRRIYVNP